MSRWSGPRRSGGPWYGIDFERLHFERGATTHFADLLRETIRSGPDVGRRYNATLEVPHYESRRVMIVFRQHIPTYPEITADGPLESPHRYPSGQICAWHPDDPADSRWIFGDGLLMLLGLLTAHLFREAWWRETGWWLGPEVRHVPPEKKRPAVEIAP